MTLTTIKDFDGAWPRYRVLDTEREEIGTIALRPTEHAGTVRAVFKARRHIEFTNADLCIIAEILAALTSDPGSDPAAVVEQGKLLPFA